MNILIFILVAYGMTGILVYGKIFEGFREKCIVLKCAQCTGFWVGVLLWLLNIGTELFTFDYSLVTGFMLGCLASGTSYILNMLVSDDGLRARWKLQNKV